MRLLRTKNEREWSRFLQLSSEEQLNAERWELTKEIRQAKARRIDIQRELDKRFVPPPDRGQEVHV